jgi:hypothetical protein
MNKTVLFILGLAVVVFVFIVYNRSDVPEFQTETQPESMTVNLLGQNDSGETGVATLTEKGGKVTVTLSMQGYPVDIPQPAHIHIGVCPDVGAVKYPLNNVDNGTSETTLDVTLAQLKSELPLGINVHKSGTEAGVFTACGDLY